MQSHFEDNEKQRTAAEQDRSKLPPLTEGERQGQAYLAAKRREDERRKNGYRIDPRPEKKPDGEEPVFKKVCREARNLLRAARQEQETDLAAAWYVFDCREEMRRQTREASHEAGVWLRDHIQRQARLKAEDEAIKDGKAICEDCGEEIDAKYTRCFKCNSDFKNGR